MWYNDVVLRDQEGVEVHRVRVEFDLERDRNNELRHLLRMIETNGLQDNIKLEVGVTE